MSLAFPAPHSPPPPASLGKRGHSPPRLIYRVLRGFLPPILLSLSACEPRLIPLPEQQPEIVASDPPDVRYLVRMAAPRPDQRIVKDISGLSTRSRWTGPNPTVGLKLPDSGPWVARVEFLIHDTTWRTTGPLTVTLYLNGQRLLETRYETAGPQILTAPVPAPFVPPSGEVTLSARIHPVWVAPSDGVALGVLLSAIGVVRP